jgi:hypothetical protein
MRRTIASSQWCPIALPPAPGNNLFDFLSNPIFLNYLTSAVLLPIGPVAGYLPGGDPFGRFRERSPSAAT